MVLQRQIWLFALLLLTGCSSVQVSQDYLPDTRFFDLKTYQWQSETQKPTGNKQADNPLLNKRIRSAIDQTLANKGYRKITEGTPDFYLAYTYMLKSKLESRDSGVGVGYGFGVGRPGSFASVGINSGQEIREYNQGNLLIDLIHPESKELMWRGTGTRRVSDHSTPEKTTKMVNEMVAKILNQFPPLP